MTDKSPLDKALISMGPRELVQFLTVYGQECPIFIWGQPGVGKTAIIKQFANHLGIEVAILIASQMTPQDIYGLGRISDGHTHFYPPSMIAKEHKYCLFLDEFNTATADVQKAFYQLVYERTIADYKMPEGSLVIAAGNRANDHAIVHTLSSALINRMINIQLLPSFKDWYDWAMANDIHPLILEYLHKNPTQICDEPHGDTQTPFTTPRSWDTLSIALKRTYREVPFIQLTALTNGLLSPNDAKGFLNFIQDRIQDYNLSCLLADLPRWPDPDKDYGRFRFLARQLRKYLHENLHENEALAKDHQRELAEKGFELLNELSKVDIQTACSVILYEKKEESLPKWYVDILVSKIPGLVNNS
jgi:hypothetical protein